MRTFILILYFKLVKEILTLSHNNVILKKLLETNMNKFFVFIVVFLLGGCSTVAGVGKDVTDAAEWSKDKISKQMNNKK